MKYYRVKPQCNNIVRYTYNNQGQVVPDGVLTDDELYTTKEYERLAMSPEWFDIVEIPKTRVHFSFGKCFELTEDVNVVAFDKHTGFCVTTTACPRKDAPRYAKYYRSIGYNARILTDEELDILQEKEMKERRGF